MYSPEADIEKGKDDEIDSFVPKNTFERLNPRIGFIRKVYGVLCFQLLLTTFLCMIAMFSTQYQKFMFSQAGFALLIFSIISSLCVVIFLVCPCCSFARKTPTNYILLFLFTTCEGYMVSYSCAATEKGIVLMAAAMTLGVTIALTIYAFTTKQDFTMMGGILFVIGAVFFMFGLFLLFTNIYFLHIIYSALGVILYGVYLIYDTQLILGGKHQELSIDDYIVGALMLYLDIIMIFLYILDLFSRKE